MTHIVLLGDSIFDNAAYVAGGPDVVHQLRAILPSGWHATLNARDGAVIADLPQQLKTLPSDATHLVVSVDCIDLRILCDDDRDFANPIEPSIHGGAKIANAILHFAAPSAAPYPRVIAR